VPLCGRLDAQQVGDRGRDSIESHVAVDAPAVEAGHVRHERDVDQLVVQLRIMREVAVFLKLLAVVARDQHRGVVGDARGVQTVEQPADAGVDLSYRRLIQSAQFSESALVDFEPETRSGVRVEHLMRTDDPVRHLADVPRRGDVRGMGVHVMDPQEERLVGVVDKLGRCVLHVEHARGVEERPVIGVATELRPEPADRRGRELDPRLDGRVRGEIAAVHAGADARDERLELVEPVRVPPVVGEEAVCGVEPAGRDPRLGECLREGVGLVDADVARPGEHRLGGEDRRK